MCTCVYVCVRVCVRVYVRVYIRVCVCVRVCVFVRLLVSVHVCMRARVLMCVRKCSCCVSILQRGMVQAFENRLIICDKARHLSKTKPFVSKNATCNDVNQLPSAY